MATHTVTQEAQNASKAKVNSESGFWRRWRKSAPAAHATQPEPDHFPHPDAPTQALPPIPKRETPRLQPVAAPAAHAPRIPGADSGDLAINIAGIAIWAAKNNLSASWLLHELEGNLAKLRTRADADQAAADKFAQRSEQAAKAAFRVAQTIEAAVAAEDAARNVPGANVAVEIDPDALGARLGAVMVNAHHPAEQTMTLEAPITDDMPDPRTTAPQPEPAEPAPGAPLLAVSAGVAAPSSPLRAPDGEVHPPVPGDGECEVPGEPLPRRVRQIPYCASDAVADYVAAQTAAEDGAA